MAKQSGAARNRGLRETRWPRYLGASVTGEMARRVEAAADRNGVSVASVIRDAIDAGMPAVERRGRRGRKGA